MLVAVPLHCAGAATDLPLPNSDFWGDTTIVLPEGIRGPQHHLFDEGARPDLSCRSLFARFPVAVLL
jgi:maltooligosyltrehalose synthase